MLEAVVGFLIASSTVMLVGFNVSESQKVLQAQKYRVDCHLAAKTLTTTNVNQVTLHDHQFEIAKEAANSIWLKDVTTDAEIKINKD